MILEFSENLSTQLQKVFEIQLPKKKGPFFFRVTAGHGAFKIEGQPQHVRGAHRKPWGRKFQSHLGVGVDPEAQIHKSG